MRSIFCALLPVLFWTVSAELAPAQAAAPKQAVANALAAQNAWLGTGSNAGGWKKYLRTSDLEQQLAAPAADRAAVAAILAQYESAASGLEKPRFVAVKKALQAWLVDLNQPTAAELPKAAISAKASYAKADPQRLAKARAGAVAAVRKLDTFLAKSGKKVQAGWHSYLQWPQLQAELAKTGAPDPAVLAALTNKFFQNENGLELAPFLAARAALRELTVAASLTAEGDLTAAVEGKLDDLANRLTSYAANPTDAEALAIGRTLAWLKTVDPSGTLVAQVRRHYAQPNLYLTASRKLATVGVNEKVDDISPVREVILGTQIYGKAHTQGNVSLRFAPQAEHAMFEILMTGQARSKNVGYNGPVTIHSTGLTNLSAYKRVSVDALGLHAQPAVAVADTNTSITGVGAKLRIIEKIAWSRIRQSTGEAEAIASKRAERRLEQRIDAQAADMIAKAQRDFMTKFRLPLVRKGEFPQRLELSTTTDTLRIAALQAGPARLGAASAPPALADDLDLSLRIHESLAGNASEAVLAGRTFTDEQLAELVKEATGEIPEELQISEDKDPWSLTFAEERPFSATFAGQTATLALRLSRMTRADTVVRQNVRISATYKLEQVGNGSKLTRDGEINVEYVDHKGQQSAQQIAFRTFMKRKFGSMFKEEIASEGLKLPGRWAHAGRLTLRQLQADNGWLTMGWELPPPTPKTALLLK